MVQPCATNMVCQSTSFLSFVILPLQVKRSLGHRSKKLLGTKRIATNGAIGRYERGAGLPTRNKKLLAGPYPATPKSSLTGSPPRRHRTVHFARWSAPRQAGYRANRRNAFLIPFASEIFNAIHTVFDSQQICQEIKNASLSAAFELCELAFVLTVEPPCSCFWCGILVPQVQKDYHRQQPM